jgi:hypothetical protein
MAFWLRMNSISLLVTLVTSCRFEIDRFLRRQRCSFLVICRLNGGRKRNPQFPRINYSAIVAIASKAASSKGVHS